MSRLLLRQEPRHTRVIAELEVVRRRYALTVNEAKKAISTAFAPLLREHGYTKKAFTWHGPTADTIRVLNVQQSQWGLQFYINLAIYLRPLGSLLKPAYPDCHILIRLQGVMPDATALSPLLDFERNDASPETKAEHLATFVGDYGLPWLKAWSDITYIEARLRDSSQFICPIKGAVYDHFHLPYPT